MPDSLFNIDQIREDIDLEAKRAAGRDGKGALPADVWETYSAFANTAGSTILLGVSEKKEKLVVSGVVDVDKVLEQLWQQANNPQKVSHNLLGHEHVRKLPAGNDRWVVVINVPRATRDQQPVFINGNPLTGTYKRRQSGDYRCTVEEVRRMLAEQTEDARDARILQGYTLDDLDIESLKAYRNRLAALKPDHPYNNVDNLDLLHKLGGWRRNRETSGEGITLAGLLMFGRFEAIHEAVPNYFVDYRELTAGGSKTTWADRLVPDGTWSGNLYDFYRIVIQRLFRDLKVPFRLVSTEREDETPVHKALREALVNALVHADYSARVPVLVIKTPDYFGFRNPGTMRVPIAQALEGGNSDCRNRSLQRMFSLIGLGEQAGSGIPRVLENWRTQHYRAPELWESEDPEATLMRLRTVSLLPEETLEALRKLFGKAFDQLAENEILAVSTAQIEGYVTNERMQQLCRLHPRDLTIMLKKLEDEGYLVHDGKGRGTSYRIAGTVPVDLAGSVDLSDPGERPASDPVVSSHAESSSLNKDPSSLNKDPSSLHKDPSSLHKDPSSLHKDPSSLHKGSVPPAPPPREDPELLSIAAAISGSQRVDPDVTRSTILELCRGRFLPLSDLAALCDRSAEGLRNRFVTPLVEAGSLERRFPQQPNHENQAYRTRES